MAAGARIPGPLVLVAGGSPTLTATHDGPQTSRALTLAARTLRAPRKGALVYPAVVHFNKAAAAAAGYGELFVFDRVHVIPRITDLGVLLSPVAVSVEVWNAWRRGHTLASVALAGGNGMSFAPGALPQYFPALKSAVFVVGVSPVGPGLINALLTFVFSTLTQAGLTSAITGTRVIMFSWPPAGDVLERYGYATRVQVAWDATEQRAALRGTPDREVSFDAVLGTPHHAAAVMARLYTNGRNPFTVPLWPDVAKLTAPVSAGATAVYCATAGRGFAAGAAAILWRDPDTWEAVVILSVAADHLNLSAPVVASYAIIGTFCLPSVLGRILSDPELERPNGHLAMLPAAFKVDAA